jgi:uncharacterized protein YfaS (alpha-2-macroglobulin family)
MKSLCVALLLIVTIILGACVAKSKVSSAEFGKYISGFTSGTVKPDEEIRIELSQTLLDSTHIDKTDTAFLEKNMRISPSVEGRFYWKNEKTIAFQPTEKFKEGKEYHVSLKLNKFKEVPSDFKTFEFLFETEKQTFKVVEIGLSAYEDYHTDWQKYEMMITSNVDLDTAELKKCFSATIDGKSLKIRSVTDYEHNYRVTIDSIQRKEKAGTLTVNWNAKKVGAKEKSEQQVLVPSLGNFSLLRAEVKDDGDQKVIITFTEPILPDQNFEGLISVEGASRVTFQALSNVVTVFMQERLKGEKKISINKGIKNYSGHKMDSAATAFVVFNGPKPALRMESKGSILPNSQGLLFPFESIGIHSVDIRIIKIKEQNMHQFLQANELDGYDELTRVGKIAIEKTIRIIADTVTPQDQWTTHILDLGKLIQPEPGSLYRVCIRFKKAYTFLPCKNEKEEEDSEYIYDVAPEQDKSWSEYGWHGEGFDGYNTWRYNDDEPCEDRYYRGGAISKNILASDIGVIYQEEKNKTARIVTTNLLNALPLGHTEVTLYSYTHEKIASGTTDEEGFLHLALGEKPFLLVAKKDKQRAYLKLTNSNCLSTAKFNVEGTDQGNGLKGFLYAERGVWRPGDSVFLNFVLNDKGNPLPENHPIQFELSDPDGKVMFKKIITENTGHIYPLYFKTSDNAPMGSYTAKVTIGNAVFSKNILLEFIVPNRMKLNSNIEGKVLTTKDSITMVQVKWLNGAVARGLKTQATITLRPDRNCFSKYGDYNFIAPYNENFKASFELPETQTNDTGTAVFRNAAMQVPDASGMLKVSCVYKAYEQGGGFSIDKADAGLSLFDSYIGIKRPTGTQYSGSLDNSKSYPFGYVLLDKNQAKVIGHHVQLKIYEMQYQRWYEADADDITSFRTQTSKICIKDTQWVAANGEGTFNFGNIGKKYGRYLMVLKDLASGHETGCVTIFDDPYWDRYGNEDADYESIVQLSVSKANFKVGEKVQLNVPSGENANILVNIQSDAKVLQQFWVKGSASHKAIEFTATPEMAPGIYIHATVLQPHHYTKDGSPIRQYGILPVKIEDPATKLKPLISMKEEIRPENRSAITISEEGGKEMYYSLVLVDEGLLDLTHYKTPDIWQQMNAQQSLKIKTWDMFNQVIGAYSGKIENVFTIGGDGSYGESENTKANRFKPAIINLGTFHLKGGQKMQHTFSVPNYSGSMKAFVVAYHDGKSGSNSKAFFVRKPIMLLTGAPRVMSATETYKIPVTVFNTDKKAKKVSVTMNINGLSNYKLNLTQSLNFKSDGDDVANFDLTLPEEAGRLHVSVTATDGIEKATEVFDIDVKSTRPAINHQRVIAVAPGAAQVFDLSPKGMKGSYHPVLDLSDILNFDFGNNLDYLIEYPHGCVEQTTSSAFAQLFLNDVQDLDQKEADDIKKHVESVIRRLSQYQTYNGGFAYWPYQYDVNEYASVYVLQFMTEAQRKGFEVPKYMLDNAVNYQKQQAGKYDNAGDPGSYDYRDAQLAQAYRLYILADMNKPDITAMNKLLESTIQSDLSRALLSKAYHTIARNNTALELVNSIYLKKPQFTTTSFSSDLRDRSMMLMALQNNANTISCQPLADGIAAELSTGWNSTLSTSMALVALSKYYGLSNPVAKKYTINGQQGVMAKHSQRIDLSRKAGGSKFEFRNTSAQKIYLALNEYYADLNDNVPLVNNGMQLKVTYLNMTNGVINETALPHSTNFMVKIQVTNTTDAAMQRVALDYLIANGWQFISNRYLDDDDVTKNSAYNFKNVQDDRMNMFFDLMPKETKTFYAQLNASYKGRFYLPLVQCYPMYNELYKAQVAGKWVVVK